LTNIKLSAAQCRMARAALQLGVRELAKLTGVSPTTIGMFERGKTTQPTPETLAAIRHVFEEAGLEFTNDDAPGVRFRPAAP
jgi:transcriptional regulator with XRE-family HTH domain